MQKHEIVKNVLINIGLLTDQKFKKAVEEQSQSKERLSNVFVKLGYISNQNVGKTLIPQIGILPQTLNIQDIEKKH